MGTNPNELETEKRFMADIERAMALSLETLELEKIRAKQRQMTPELASDPKAVSQTREEYLAYLQRRVACGTGKVPSSSTLAPPEATAGPSSMGPVRRHSDCRNPATMQAGGGSNGTAEADLISFSAVPKPPDPKEEAHNNLKDLVEQMHRLNTPANSAPQFDQGFKTQRSMSMTSATYGFHPAAYLSAVPQQPPVVQGQLQGPYSAASMQLVPYNNQKPKPLTPEELHRLYNSPPIYAVAAASGGPPAIVPPPVYGSTVTAPVYGGVPSAYGVVGYPTVSATIPHPSIQHTAGAQPSQPLSSLPQPAPFVATVAPSLYPTLPTSSNAHPVGNAESALVHVPKLGATGRSYSQPHSIVLGNTSVINRQPSPARGTDGGPSSTSTSSGSSSVVLRPKSDPLAGPGKRVGANGTDLIDLGFEDNSRVSVLEAFDPLLCGNRSSSSSGEEDKGNTAHLNQH